jgi:hypothetical protein
MALSSAWSCDRLCSSLAQEPEFARCIFHSLRLETRTWCLYRGHTCRQPEPACKCSAGSRQLDLSSHTCHRSAQCPKSPKLGTCRLPLRPMAVAFGIPGLTVISPLLAEWSSQARTATSPQSSSRSTVLFCVSRRWQSTVSHVFLCRPSFLLIEYM